MVSRDQRDPIVLQKVRKQARGPTLAEIVYEISISN